MHFCLCYVSLGLCCCRGYLCLALLTIHCCVIPRLGDGTSARSNPNKGTDRATETCPDKETNRATESGPDKETCPEVESDKAEETGKAEVTETEVESDEEEESDKEEETGADLCEHTKVGGHGGLKHESAAYTKTRCRLHGVVCKGGCGKTLGVDYLPKEREGKILLYCQCCHGPERGDNDEEGPSCGWAKCADCSVAHVNQQQTTPHDGGSTRRIRRSTPRYD
jgi:hypothetical protein